MITNHEGHYYWDSSVYSLLTVVTIGLNAFIAYHSAVIAYHEGHYSMALAGFEPGISQSAVPRFTICAIAPFLKLQL